MVIQSQRDERCIGCGPYTVTSTSGAKGVDYMFVVDTFRTAGAKEYV